MPSWHQGRVQIERDLRQVRFSGPGATNQPHVALIGDEGAACKLANQARMDRCTGDVAVVEVFRRRQLRDGHLVFDGTRLLLGNLGLQQVTDDAGRFVLARDAGGHDLVIGTAHPVKLEAAHQVEDLGAFHMC